MQLVSAPKQKSYYLNIFEEFSKLLIYTSLDIFDDHFYISPSTKVITP